MKIREDYVGNVVRGKTIHGLKYNTLNRSSIVLFCGSNYNGCAHHRSAEKLSEVDKKSLAETITCNRCRHILGMSNKSPKKSEKPDYFLIIDTASGIPKVLVPVAACRSTKELKDILDHEAGRQGFDHVKTYYQVVGLKKVEDIHFDIIPKGYDVVLTKQ